MPYTQKKGYKGCEGIRAAGTASRKEGIHMVSLENEILHAPRVTRYSVGPGGTRKEEGQYLSREHGFFHQATAPEENHITCGLAL